MTPARKPFRIEAMFGGGTQPIRSDSEPLFQRILFEIEELKRGIGPAQEANGFVEAFRAELAEAQKLKFELDQIYEAINRTKLEIATIHKGGFDTEEVLRVSNELDAVVGGTEKATESILAAAEAIDEDAATLAPMLSDEHRGLASDISEKVVQIFEACNFQDLTGQRISKVVSTFSFIEERIIRMMEIWGGIESFRELPVDDPRRREGDAALLNGPALDDDPDIASQDDIDALFA